MVSADDFTWISNFLSTYDGDLLEFELDVDCQHFFDNMDAVLAQESPNDHRQSPLQLTPFVLSVISDLQDSVVSEKGEEPAISFCELLKEAQSAVKSERKVRHATTAPRTSRRLKRQRKTTAASSASEKRTTRSSSRKLINRRLFQ